MTSHKTSDQTLFEMTGTHREGLSDEDVYPLALELRKMGLDKPKDITWHIWLQPLASPMKYADMAVEQALGASVLSSGANSDYSGNQSHIISRTPAFKGLVKELQGDIVVHYRKELAQRAAKAMRVYDEILDGEDVKHNVKLQAASQIMEHVVGKASQVVEHKGNLLAEVITHVDKLREAGLSDINLTKTPDVMDDLVDTLIPEGLVVGKRS